jgi:hypothetical protein
MADYLCRKSRETRKPRQNLYRTVTSHPCSQASFTFPEMIVALLEGTGFQNDRSRSAVHESDGALRVLQHVFNALVVFWRHWFVLWVPRAEFRSVVSEDPIADFHNAVLRPRNIHNSPADAIGRQPEDISHLNRMRRACTYKKAERRNDQSQGSHGLSHDAERDSPTKERPSPRNTDSDRLRKLRAT